MFKIELKVSSTIEEQPARYRVVIFELQNRPTTTRRTSACRKENRPLSGEEKRRLKRETKETTRWWKSGEVVGFLISSFSQVVPRDVDH